MPEPKPTLETNVQELLGLFPRKLERLDAIVSPLDVGDLGILYLQHDVYDSRRDWEAYHNWKAEDKVHVQKQDGPVKDHLPLPSHIDKLYHLHSGFLGNFFSPNDRLLLTIRLLDVDPHKEVVTLGHMRRNKGSDLKGLGREYYKSISHWFRDKGMKYVRLLPMDEALRGYWRSNGFLPVYELPDKHRQRLLKISESRKINVHGDIVIDVL